MHRFSTLSLHTIKEEERGAYLFWEVLLGLAVKRGLVSLWLPSVCFGKHPFLCPIDFFLCALTFAEDGLSA